MIKIKSTKNEYSSQGDACTKSKLLYLSEQKNSGLSLLVNEYVIADKYNNKINKTFIKSQQVND